MDQQRRRDGHNETTDNRRLAKAHDRTNADDHHSAAEPSQLALGRSETEVVESR